MAKNIEWDISSTNGGAVNAPVDDNSINDQNAIDFFTGKNGVFTGTNETTANSVEYSAQFLANTAVMEQGLLTSQHNRINNIKIMGTSKMHLEIGDTITIADAGFAARSIKVNGASFANKEWLIVGVNVKENEMTFDIINQQVFNIASPVSPAWRVS